MIFNKARLQTVFLTEIEGGFPRSAVFLDICLKIMARPMNVSYGQPYRKITKQPDFGHILPFSKQQNLKDQIAAGHGQPVTKIAGSQCS